jgi:hypothetical protein
MCVRFQFFRIWPCDSSIGDVRVKGEEVMRSGVDVEPGSPMLNEEVRDYLEIPSFFSERDRRFRAERRAGRTRSSSGQLLMSTHWACDPGTDIEFIGRTGLIDRRGYFLSRIFSLLSATRPVESAPVHGYFFPVSWEAPYCSWICSLPPGSSSPAPWPGFTAGWCTRFSGFIPLDFICWRSS